MINYEAFYRKYGIRKLTDIIIPRVQDLTSFELPRLSLMHDFSYDTSHTGPDDTLFYYSNTRANIYTDLISEYAINPDIGLLGNPIYHKKSLLIEFKKYLSNHPKFIYRKNILDIKPNPSHIVVLCYGFLAMEYVYRNLPLTGYNKYMNFTNTLMSTVKRVFNVSGEYQQFLVIKIPEIIPPYSSFNKFLYINNITSVKEFNTPEKLFIKNLYEWIDPTNNDKFNVFNNLTADELDKFNIVFMYGSKCVILNIGILNKLREGNIKDDNTNITVEITPGRLRKLLIMFFVRLQESGISLIDTDSGSDIESIDEVDTDHITDDEDNDSDDIVEVGNTPPIIHNTLLTKKNIGQKDNLHIHKEDPSSNNNIDLDTEEINASDIVETLDNIDNNLKAHDILITTTNKITDVKSKEELVNKYLTPKTPEEAFTNTVSTLKDSGIINTVQANSFYKGIEKFSNSPNPFTNDAPISAFKHIKEEDIIIPDDATNFESSPTIVDEAMTKSTLKVFDKSYVNNVLKKDILNMVMSVQNNGIAINNYEIDKVPSIMGDSEIHTIVLKPLTGKSSIIKFKLPVIKDDGTFTANNISYKMRKQRFDLPIRKISPDAVALTSYYGKFFVNRTPYESRKLETYIFKNIFEYGIQTRNGWINKVHMENVFDNLFKAPRIYSTIASYFKTFNAGNIFFNFNHKDRETLQSKYTLKDLEKKKMILCGIDSTTNDPVLVGDNNEFYIYKNNDYINIGDIFTILKISNKAPIDYSTVKVLGKNIPIVILLGHYMGLSNLLQLLDYQPRVMLKNDNYVLGNNEYFIYFKDVKMVVDRSKVKESLILGGFQEYDNIIRKYTLNEFDNTSVYFNLIQSKKLSPLYMKEFDILKDMFIDHITKELLHDMKEPETWVGLLLRATELLMVDYHPDVLDMRYMRLRGYERIAGAIYHNIVKSVRNFNMKNYSGNSSIEMNPYSVWTTITTDSSNIILDEINPMQLLKQNEGVTFTGLGGRNKDTLNKPTRVYHPTDMGVISESTVFTGEVGISTYVSANPRLKNLRGQVSPFDFEKDGATSLLSTSSLTSVGAEHDD